MFLAILLSLAQIAGAALALAVAFGWRGRASRPAHRPVAYFLTYTVLADSVRWILLTVTLHQPAPYSGSVRLAFLVREALYWGWMFGAVGVACVVYARRSAKPIAAAYALAVVALCLAYPAISGRPINVVRALLHAAEAAYIVVSFARWATRKPDDMPIAIEQAAVLLIGAADLALFGGAYLPLLPFAPAFRWPMARVSYLALYLALIVIHWRQLCSNGSFASPRSSPRSGLH